jgi:DNA-binding transcriptional LysR family regulator
MNESAERFYDPALLRTFLAVAQSLSFTRAAEVLGLRQPTVSQQIRKLETTIGRPLFVRDTRRVALTADGEALAGFARSILAANEQAIGFFTGSGISGRLRLGVTDDIALTQVPRILRDFRQLYPRVALELTVSQGTTLQRRLESGHLDPPSSSNPPGRSTRVAVSSAATGWCGRRRATRRSKRTRRYGWSSIKRPARVGHSRSRHSMLPVPATGSRARSAT